MDTINNHAGDEGKIFHLIERLGDKLDALILSLPGNYVQKVEYDPWRNAVEGRLLILESDAKTGKEWANSEHKGLSDTVQAAERRIMAELKENSQTTRDNARAAKATRLTIWMCSIGWFITLALFVVNLIASRVPVPTR